MADQASSASPAEAVTGPAAPTARLGERVELAGGSFEEAVSFAVDGEHLRGNLVSRPDPGPTAVLFLHGWGGVRSGPHNLLTSMARAVGEAGFASLRFDFRGRGESEGDGASASLPSMATDTLAAAAYLKDRSGACNLVLVGICSGGNVGIGVLDRLAWVNGLFLLSVYPFSDGDSFGRDARRTAHFLKVYWGKLWQARTWRKLVHGEVDFRQIFNVLFGHFRKREEPAEDNAEEAPDETPPGALHLDNLLRQRLPVRMLYGGADPDFKASLDYYRGFSEAHDYGIEFETIDGANHNFYAQEWKAHIVEQLIIFLQGLPQ